MAPSNQAQAARRTKVAVLGGGPASLAAVYYLTSREPDRYDITVYEMSWRLGGKTSSGRDGPEARILEHGLHVVFGGYHNVFDMMLGCYDALRTEVPEAATYFRTFFEALTPREYGVVGDERPPGPWHQIDLQFPVNRGVPGDAPLPKTSDLASNFIQLGIHGLFGARALRRVQRILGSAIGYRRKFPNRPRPPPGTPPQEGGDWLVRSVIIPALRALLDKQTWSGRAFLPSLKAFQKILHGVEIKSLRRRAVGQAWTLADMVLAILIGASEQRVYAGAGYDAIDGMDFRAWLKRHGAREYTVQSPLVRIIYDAAFSYPNGGQSAKGRTRATQRAFLVQSMAAGAALRIIVWMFFTYKGSLFFKMRAGMGEVIHVPLYHLLRARGVKFKFLHRVKGLTPGIDAHGSPVIDQVHLDQIARPRKGNEYHPLVHLKDADVWPFEPIKEEINEHDYEAAQHAEDFFSPAQDRPLCLHRRSDAASDAVSEHTFDKIIFGIPVACIPFICPNLKDTGNWGIQNQVGTTQTVALQVWSKYSLSQLGWPDPPPLLSLFWDPLNTWCDMGQVLDREHWPSERRPRMVAYFCGPLPHEWHGQPESVRENPVANEAWKALALTEANVAADTLFSHLSELWPGFGTPVGTGQVLHWNILNDPLNRKGEQRRRAQYLRANIDPHERCTLALPGESENRIRPDATGFANLTVAGDWTANDILAACFEGAVQGGILAARATSDRKDLYPIIGSNLLNPGPRLPPRGPSLHPSLRPPASSAPPSLQPQAGPGVGPTDANPSLGGAEPPPA